MALIEDGSILMSIKKLLNVEHDDPAFDMDIGMAINAEFMTLHQLGIGPDEGFYVNDADTVWTDFSTDKTLLHSVKQYIYLKVRMIFDPPASSIVADACNNRISELEFRLNVQAERNQNENSETETPKEETVAQTVTTVNTILKPSKPKPPKPRSSSDYAVDGENMQLFNPLF